MIKRLALVFILLGTTLQAQTYGGSSHWLQYRYVNADVVALGANFTGELKVATLAPYSVVEKALFSVATPCAGPATLTVSVGPDGSETTYILPSNAKAAANTVYGDGAAEIGASLSDGIGTMVSATDTVDIKASFIATVQNLDQVTTCSGTIWLNVSHLL